MSAGASALPPATEALEAVRAACAELERQAVQMAAVRDPVAPFLGMTANLGRAQFRLLADAFLKLDADHQATARMIEAARQPASDDEMRALCRAASSGAARHALALARAANRRTLAIVACAALALCAGSAGAGYWWRGEVPAVAGVAAGAERCADQDGGVLCWIPVWRALPPSR
jgi:hypothetical protein